MATKVGDLYKRQIQKGPSTKAVDSVISRNDIRNYGNGTTSFNSVAGRGYRAATKAKGRKVKANG